MPVFVWSDMRGKNIAHLLVWLLFQPRKNTVMAAVSVKREVVIVLGYTMAAATSFASARKE